MLKKQSRYCFFELRERLRSLNTELRSGIRLLASVFQKFPKANPKDGLVTNFELLSFRGGIDCKQVYAPSKIIIAVGNRSLNTYLMSLSPEETKLIEDEERELANVIDSLKAQFARGQERFHTEKDRARVLTAELVASRRSEEKQMLASDEAISHQMTSMKKDELDDIKKLLSNPYFARIVLRESINGKLKEIHYKIGSKGNIDTRIIDWRKAPVSKLYYEYREGDEYFETIQGKDREGTIVTRNKLRIENGHLLEVTNNKGSFVKENGEWKKSYGSTGKQSSSGRMPDVLSLITKEQFKSITEDADRAVLIQGVAGSGKTTIAIYRVSWLLHEGNSDLSARNVVVLLKSKVLRRYIESSLESLSIFGLPTFTYQDWLAKCIKSLFGREIKAPSERVPYLVYRLKTSLAILRALESLVGRQNKNLLNVIRQKLDLSEFPQTVATCMDEQEILEEAPRAFLRRLSALIRYSEKKESHPDAHQQALAIIGNFDKELSDYSADILRVMSNPGDLIEFDESGFLDKELILEARDVTSKHFSEGVMDQADKTLILLLHQLKTGESLNHFGNSERYGHVVIDEIQDFRAVELAIIFNACRSRSELTLAGDHAQDLGENRTFTGWDSLKDYWGMSDARYVELKISHRSTREIIAFAGAIQGVNSKISGRPGKPPLWYHALDEEQAIVRTIEWLERAIGKHPQHITALLVPSQRHATYVNSLLEPTFGSLVRIGEPDSFTFDEGIIVSSIPVVKGLEFKSVLIWDASAANFPKNKRSQNLLYTGVTRAEDNLCLVTWKDRVSPVLPSINSRFVRGIVEEQEKREKFDPRELR